jgi:hypothetical protein
MRAAKRRGLRRLNALGRTYLFDYEEDLSPHDDSVAIWTRYFVSGGIVEGPPETAWRLLHEHLNVPFPEPPAPAPSPESAAVVETPVAASPAGDGRQDGSQRDCASETPDQPSALHRSSDDETHDPEEDEDENERPKTSAQIWEEALVKTLTRPAVEYDDEPPPEMPGDIDAEIRALPTEQEAAEFIEDIDRNIDLEEAKYQAVRRAEKLRYLERANRAKRCAHVKADGATCGSPAKRGRELCHFHEQASAAGFELPVLEDRHSLQLAFTRLAMQVAAGKMDANSAKVLVQIFGGAWELSDAAVESGDR